MLRTHCPTCKQHFTGTVNIELCRAYWELNRSRPEADVDRLVALRSLAAALLESGDSAAARPLYEDLVTVHRRTRGNDNPVTLEAIGRLGTVLSEMAEHAEAQPLLEEAVAGLRLALGDEDGVLLRTMSQLAVAHGRLGAMANSRLLFEEVVAIQRRTFPAGRNTFSAIGNLGTTIVQIGDSTAALALLEEAVASGLRELGPNHPCTQGLAAALAETRHDLSQYPCGARARGNLVGLASKPELNGKLAYVVGFDTAKGRYRVRHGNIRTDKPIGIKPENLILYQGSAVIVEGLDAAPEWNGKRGLVESYDAAKGRYRLLVRGRTKALGVKALCCKLEFAAEQQEHEHQATRRARVEANVRVALAAREPAPESEAKAGSIG
jgi:hypothetical protein